MATSRKKYSHWRRRANCRKPKEGYTREQWINIFFSNGNRLHRYDEAKLICKDCTVKIDCLMFALENHEKYDGVYGGYTPIERRVMFTAMGARKKRKDSYDNSDYLPDS